MAVSVVVNKPVPPPQLAGERASVVGRMPTAPELLNVMLFAAVLHVPLAEAAVR
jgi:hypothetical protein